MDGKGGLVSCFHVGYAFVEVGGSLIIIQAESLIRVVSPHVHKSSAIPI